MSDNILKDIRQGLGLDEDDNSQDEIILAMNPESQFELWCRWNGLLGSLHSILSDVVLELFKEKNNG